MNKVQSKAELIVKINGVSQDYEKLMNIFSSVREKNTSCFICKFFKAGCCERKKSLKYFWKDSFGNSWCVAWLDPKNRKKKND